VALPLPDGFTIRPEGERRLMAVNARGTVVATMSIPKLDYLNDRAIRWRAGRRAEIFAPLPGTGHGAYLPAGPQTLTALSPDDVAYVEVARTFSGGYAGVSTETQRWDGRRPMRVEAKARSTCGATRRRTKRASGPLRMMKVKARSVVATSRSANARRSHS